MADPILKITLDLDGKTVEAQVKKIEGNLKDAGERGADSFKRSFDKDIFSGFKRQLLAIGATVLTAFAFDKTIKAAQEQENAINDLNRALQASGQYSDQVSQSLQRFASDLQSVTTVGDEVILNTAALIQNLGQLDEQGLKRATKAAINLSEGLGIDLNAATLLVGKAAQGQIDTFSRYGLAIEKGSNNAQTFANTLSVLEQRFGTAATSKLNTFEGVTTNIKNAFGDLLEEVGNLIIKSPALIGVFKVIGQTIADLTKSFADFAGKKPLDDLIRSTLTLASVLNESLTRPFQVFFQFVGNGINFVKMGIQELLNGVLAGALKVAELTSKFGIGQGIVEELKLLQETTSEVANEFRAEFVDGILSDQQAEDLSIRIDNYIQKLMEAANASTSFGTTAGNSFRNLSNTVKTETLDITNTVKNGLTNTIAQSFAQLGKTLAGAGGGFKQFLAIVVSALGDLAISIGTTVIGAALAIDALKASVVGTGAIGVALGGALVAIGAALKVFSSSLGGSGGGAPISGFDAGVGGGGGGLVTSGASFAAPEERVEPETKVVVNVQGSILDSDETGLRIANILKEASLNNNVKASVFA